ncbi:ABC-2 type transport system permease protein [Kibdelosporangium banguiense]|uniref:Transport permease protein n=1 Tax=Kibdelosporangium banguiense TaxID=1365924 RepID=A0ABS4T988_9PSEU|nr:ABC transporter permease [Kibdelosporangium banguiense]MBP2320988.1 ABC-2 type transport system permease protein [Kibdelosporangium banguiense]
MSYAIADARTMLRRQYKHAIRYPAVAVSSLFLPLMFLLLFVYVFGGSMGGGLSAGSSYVDYVVPGIIFMCISSGAAQTSVGAASDMTEGIISRFRSMSISRASVLTAHVLANVIRTMAAIVFMLAVALLIGFAPTAGVLEWLAFLGAATLFSLMISWLAVAFGLNARSLETANGASLPLQFLPFISSAFVPPESASAGVRWFMANQPFTPMIETIRGLLLGAPIGSSLVVSIGWAVGFSVIGYLWARKLYNRERV